MSDFDFSQLDLSQYPEFDVAPPKPPPGRVRTIVYFSSSQTARVEVTSVFLWRVANNYIELANYMRRLIERNFDVNKPLSMTVYGPDAHHVSITGHQHGAIYNIQGEYPSWSEFVANAKNVRFGYHRMEIFPIEGGDEMPFRAQNVQPNTVHVLYHRGGNQQEWINFTTFEGYDDLWSYFQTMMRNPNSGIYISWLSSTLKQFYLIFKIPNDHQNPDISFADFSAFNVYKFDVYFVDEDEDDDDDEEGEDEKNEE